MIARDLERLLPEISGRTTADLEIRFRKLREMRLLPVGGRGRHAPDLDAEHVATILLAVAGARKATDAAYAAMHFARLREGGREDGVLLPEALAEMLASAECAADVQQIVLCKSYLLAVIHCSALRVFALPDICRDMPGIVDQTVIGGDLVRRLAAHLAGA